MSNPYTKAIKEANRRIPLLSVKQRNEMLGCFCGDFAEAYEVGVQEAQDEIVYRLQALATKEEPSK